MFRRNETSTCDSAHHIERRTLRTRALLTHLPIVLGLALASIAGAISGSCARDQHRTEVMQGECYTCHEERYLATTEPPHPGLFETTCADCHVTSAWVPAQAIQHDWFVLRNLHARTPCGSCHTTGYRPGDTPDTCVGCHQAEYDRVHQGTYPTTCADCHTDAGWRPSTFVHSWPLDGGHAATACTSCHVGEPAVYRGTPTQCAACHSAEWDRASTRPDLSHATFPMTCASCHTTIAWMPALSGAHPETQFPLGGGPHQPFASACLDCHDPARGSSIDGMNTDCIGCHTGEHERAEADADHREVGGYPFGDPRVNFCLDCHPSGSR